MRDGWGPRMAGPRSHSLESVPQAPRGHERLEAARRARAERDARVPCELEKLGEHVGEPVGGGSELPREPRTSVAELPTARRSSFVTQRPCDGAARASRIEDIGRSIRPVSGPLATRHTFETSEQARQGG